MMIFHTDGDPQEVAARLARVSQERLARFKQPRHAIANGGPLPRTFSGKLSKVVLRDEFSSLPVHAITLER